MADPRKNFAFGTVLTAPSPATSGTTLVLASGQGANFPQPSTDGAFNVVVYPSGALPLSSNSEIVRCTARSTDTLTITRTQESTSARTILAGDYVAAAVTEKAISDLENLTVYYAQSQRYGAKADGTTDDSAAVNAAITAANAAGGGIVQLGKGTILANDLVWKSNVHVRGMGDATILLQKSGVADNTYLLSAFGTGTTTASNVTNVSIKNLTMQGRSDTDTFTQYVHLIEFSGVTDAVVDCVKFKNWRGDAIILASNLNGGTQVERHNERITVMRCGFNGGAAKNNRNAITIQDGTDVFVGPFNHVTSCTAATMPGAIDIEPNSVTYTILRNIHIIYNVFDAVGGDAGVIGYFHQTAQASLTTPVQHFNIEGNVIRNSTNSTGAIFLRCVQTPTASTVAHEIFIVGNRIHDCAGVPVDIEGIRGVRMERDYFARCDNAFSIGFSEKCMDIVLANSTLDKIGLSEGTAIGIFSVDGFYIDEMVFDLIGDQAGTGRMVSFNAGSGGTSTSSNVRLRNATVRGFISTISAIAGGHTLTLSSNTVEGVLTGTTLVPNPAHWTDVRHRWITLSKAADQAVINSTTLVDDSTLQFPMLASTKYRIRGRIFWDTTAAGDMKYTFVGPAAALIRTHIVAPIAGAAPAEVAIGTAYPSSSGVALAGTGTTGGYIEFDLIVHNTTAGTFVFRFAQNTASNDTGAIVRAGSYLEYSAV